MKRTRTPPAADARRVLTSLRRIVRALRLSDRSAERSLGISVAQLFVLQLVAQAPSLSISELAEATLTDLSSVSAVVRRLVERGLVERTVAASDARRAAVSVTSEGKALLRRAPRAPQASLLQAVQSLPRADVRQLAASLDTLATAMGATETTFFFEQEDH